MSLRSAVVLATACALAVGGPVARAADEPAVVLVEAASCAGPASDLPALDLREGQTLVSFEVPAITRLRLSPSTGAVGAVATNTGCAPRADDLVVLEDGTASTAAQRAAALSLAGAGDWREPGAWHAVA